MKSKSKAVKVNFTMASFKDAGYQSALAAEHLSAVAQYVVEQCPTIVEDCPKEVRDQLDAGWALRWQEINPSVTYNTEWIPMPNGGNELTLAYAMSFSQQAFGQLKAENPVQHGVIKGVRDAWNKYRSNKMKALINAIKGLNPATRERAASDNFAQYVVKAMDTMKTRCKNAVARGDDSANEVKTRQAIEAFMKTINN